MLSIEHIVSYNLQRAWLRWEALSTVQMGEMCQGVSISLGLGGGNTLAETHTQERVDQMHDRPQSEHERGRLDSLANTCIKWKSFSLFVTYVKLKIFKWSYNLNLYALSIVCSFYASEYEQQ